MKIGLIGGSGVESFLAMSKSEEKIIETPFGTATVEFGQIDEVQVVFIPRHGKAHDVLPHEVNYRANIFALKQLGVDLIFSTSAVGSLDKKFKPGDYAVLSDFIDFTKHRPASFYEKGKVIHADMSEPYDEKLNSVLKKSVKELSGQNPEEVIYVAVEGPRFETKAEIKMFQKLGGQVVGMTNFPEVVLANEVQLPYASLAIITNYACGIQKGPVTHEEVVVAMDKKKKEISEIICRAIRNSEYRP